MELSNVEIETPIYFRGTRENLVQILSNLPIILEGANPSGSFELNANISSTITLLDVLGKIVYLQPKSNGYITGFDYGEGITVDPNNSISEKITTFYYNNQRFELNHGYNPSRLPKGITLH